MSAKAKRRPVVRFAAAFAVFAVALIPFSAAAGQDSPESVIGAYHATLIDVMRRAKALGYQGRYEALEPAVDKAFNLGFIARASLSRAYWKALDKDKRATFVAAYSHLTVATYASRFSGYKGEKFEIVGSKETRRKDTLVRTRIVKSNGKAVAINYLLRNRGGKWRVIDVFLKGTISEVATRRADFSAVMRAKGFEALIAAIGGKVEVLKAD